MLALDAEVGQGCLNVVNPTLRALDPGRIYPINRNPKVGTSRTANAKTTLYGSLGANPNTIVSVSLGHEPRASPNVVALLHAARVLPPSCSRSACLVTTGRGARDVARRCACQEPSTRGAQALSSMLPRASSGPLSPARREITGQRRYLFSEVTEVHMQRSFVEAALDEQPSTRVVCKARLGQSALPAQSCMHGNRSSI